MKANSAVLWNLNVTPNIAQVVCVDVDTLSETALWSTVSPFTNTIYLCASFNLLRSYIISYFNHVPFPKFQMIKSSHEM